MGGTPCHSVGGTPCRTTAIPYRYGLAVLSTFREMRRKTSAPKTPPMSGDKNPVSRGKDKAIKSVTRTRCGLPPPANRTRGDDAGQEIVAQALGALEEVRRAHQASHQRVRG